MRGTGSMMARPNLDDPDQEKAYRLELRRYMSGWRRFGLALLLGAIVLLLYRGGGLDPVSFALLVTGWAVLIWVMVKRNAYHRARMAEPPEGD